MSVKQTSSFREIIILLMAVCFVLFINGAIPFLMLPTLGQAVWAMGFAQSFANGSLFDPYVHDFGMPNPAAIAFGLAGAWPASILIRLGLHSADAYTGMVALWLMLAMYSAYQIARRFNIARSIALLAAVAWMTMPVIWAHAGFSMLSLGIALLSFYFLAALRLFVIGSEPKNISLSVIITYFISTIVSIFMDGYTFMMFACGSSFLLLYSFITRPEIRNVFIKVAIPIHVISFTVAYALYTAFIGKSGFSAESIDMFRGWGLDLSFIVIPTKGLLWIPDLLGLSQRRNEQIYFGDASVWVTTFSLPILLLGTWAWWRSKRQFKIASGVLLIAILSFYMALGPSLKINSIKPEYLNLQVMPVEFAIAPTFNAWISENIPGFNTMRASYRWSALGIFALWLLIIIGLARTDDKNRRIGVVGLIALTLLNLPDFKSKWKQSTSEREMFQQIDQELVTTLRKHIQPGEMVSFIPWSNDFFANYLAPKAGFRTYNIGGDKNLQTAMDAWPLAMRQAGGVWDRNKAMSAIKMLVNDSTDVLVIPYFDMRLTTTSWPYPDNTKVQRNDTLNVVSNTSHLSEQQTKLKAIIDTLRTLPYIEISDSPYFVSIRLQHQLSGKENKTALLKSVTENIRYPIVIGTNSLNNPPHTLLWDGWNELEEHHAWSQTHAKLLLPVPQNCESRACHAVLNFTVFGASQEHPIKVTFNIQDQGLPWSTDITVSSGNLQKIQVPLSNTRDIVTLSISVPDATSPLLLNGTPDPRVLGIGLLRIELLNEDTQ